MQVTSQECWRERERGGGEEAPSVSRPDWEGWGDAGQSNLLKNLFRSSARLFAFRQCTAFLLHARDLSHPRPYLLHSILLQDHTSLMQAFINLYPICFKSFKNILEDPRCPGQHGSVCHLSHPTKERHHLYCQSSQPHSL